MHLPCVGKPPPFSLTVGSNNRDHKKDVGFFTITLSDHSILSPCPGSCTGIASWWKMPGLFIPCQSSQLQRRCAGSNQALKIPPGAHTLMLVLKMPYFSLSPALPTTSKAKFYEEFTLQTRAGSAMASSYYFVVVLPVQRKYGPGLA